MEENQEKVVPAGEASGYGDFEIDVDETGIKGSSSSAPNDTPSYLSGNDVLAAVDALVAISRVQGRALPAGVETTPPESVAPWDALPSDASGAANKHAEQLVVLQVENGSGEPAGISLEDAIPPVPADEVSVPAEPAVAEPVPVSSETSPTDTVTALKKFTNNGLRIFEGRIIQAKLQRIIKDLERPELLVPLAINGQPIEEVMAALNGSVVEHNAAPPFSDSWEGGYPVHEIPELPTPAAPVKEAPRAETVAAAVAVPTVEQHAPVIFPPAPAGAPTEAALLNENFAAFEARGTIQTKRKKIRRLITAVFGAALLIPSAAVILAKRYHAAPEVKSPSAAVPAAPAQRIKDCKFTITLGDTGLVGMHLFRGTPLKKGETTTGNVCFKKDPNSRSCETSRTCDVTRIGQGVTATCDMAKEETGSPIITGECK